MMRSLSCLSVLLFCVSALPAAGRLPAVVADLAPPDRASIDRTALASGMNKPVGDIPENVAAWLISQASLSAEEEAQAAQQELDRLRDKYRLHRAPPEADQLFQTLVNSLPPSAKPACFQYRLLVVEHED